jgi:GT2 family glycosyltransferase
MRDYELVVVSYRSAAHVRALLSGLPAEIPVVLVDNADGEDGLAGLAAARPGTRWLDGGGEGFAHAANLGARAATAAVVVFVNPDARPDVAVLDALSDELVREQVVAVAATPASAQGPELGCGGWEPTLPRAVVHATGLHKAFPRLGIYARPRPGEQLALDWTSAACMAVRREEFLALGGWDETYFVYCEDVAFGRTLRDHGHPPRLRTDLLVPHASGGSGAPVPEMMRLRGASLAHYLHAHRPRTQARLMTGVLALGYRVRQVQQRVRGDAARAAGHAAYARGLRTGTAWVAGREVAASRATPWVEVA